MELVPQADLGEIRKELKTYKHSDGDTALILAALEKVAVIARLPPALRKVTAEAFKRVDVPEGRKVSSAGDAADSFYVVGGGTFNLDSPEVNEGRSSLGKYTKGSIIAERVLYIEQIGRTPFSVTCEQAGVLFILPKAAFFTVKKHVDDGAADASDSTEFLTGLPVCAGISPSDIKAFAADAMLVVRSKGSAIIERPSKGNSDAVMILQAVCARARECAPRGTSEPLRWHAHGRLRWRSCGRTRATAYSSRP